MKKIVLMLMSLLLAALPVLAETVGENAVEPAAEPEWVSMSGAVIEVSEEGILIESAEMGEVLVLAGEDTLWETTRPVQPGDYIYLMFDGKMTRSIPAQVTAQVVRMHLLVGEVEEILSEENAVILKTPSHGSVQVMLPEALPEGIEHLAVWHDGAMTMSLPPQVGAGQFMAVYPLAGTVSDVWEGGFTLGEEQDAVEVYYGGELPEIGSAVTAYYNGMMTRSLPPQVTALTVVLPQENESIE